MDYEPNPALNAFMGISLVGSSLLVAGMCIITKYSGIAEQRKQDEIYQERYSHAIRIADINLDGYLSMEEKLRMYGEMRIPVNISKETRSPTINELEHYIRTYVGNKENDNHNRKRN